MYITPFIGLDREMSDSFNDATHIVDWSYLLFLIAIAAQRQAVTAIVERQDLLQRVFIYSTGGGNR